MGIDLSGGGGDQFFSASPVAGYGGVVTLERSIARKSSTGGTVSIYVGRWLGNSGQLTITWAM